LAFDYGDKAIPVKRCAKAFSMREVWDKESWGKGPAEKKRKNPNQRFPMGLKGARKPQKGVLGGQEAKGDQGKKKKGASPHTHETRRT